MKRMEQLCGRSVVARVTLCAVVAVAATGKAQAEPIFQMDRQTVSGAYGDLQWTAQRLLTGTTSTLTGGPVVNGGNPIYWPSYPRDSGVVHLVMDYGPAIGAFICSGSLMADRQSILTAGHCVSDGAGTSTPLTTTAYFQPLGGLSPGTRIQTGLVPAAGVETRNVTQYFVHGAYTGDVIDQNDIAVLRLDAPAPAWAVSYDLHDGPDLTSQRFSVAGYGRLGDGATGANGFTARLRLGDNKFDFSLGDPLFGTNWATVLGEAFSQISNVWLSDFDNGLARNDTACLVGSNPALAGAAGAVFCDLGTGAREVGVAGGDSGGPSFIDGRIATVSSFGMTFGSPFGDFLAGLNSSFGEFSGFVPVFLHQAFIRDALVGNVPEPGALSLVALAVTGWGFARRRRTPNV